MASVWLLEHLGQLPCQAPGQKQLSLAFSAVLKNFGSAEGDEVVGSQLSVAAAVKDWVSEWVEEVAEQEQEEPPFEVAEEEEEVVVVVQQ